MCWVGYRQVEIARALRYHFAMQEEAVIHYTTWPRKLLSATIFPGTLVVAVGLGIYFIGNGSPPEIVAAVISISTGVLVLALEFIHPHAKLWQKSHGDIRVDALHMFFSEVMPPQVFNLLFISALTAGSVWIAESTGTPLWPTSLPLVVQLALLLVLGEFFHYWWHRMCHEVPLLWRLHATHHSAERLYFLNAGRFHPLDTLTGYILQATPAILMGAPPELLGLFGIFTAVHGLFQHANIDVRLGPLNYIFSMAELHRWHHSKNLEDANANYGGNLIVWDIVFGTRRLPADREHQPDDVGIHMPSFPKTYFGQLASPFTWSKLKRADAEAKD